jgi:plastocyanin
MRERIREVSHSAVARGLVVAAVLGGLLALPAAAAAALPVPGARYESHDHTVNGAGWHVEVSTAKRDRRLLSTIVLYDQRCNETIAASRIRLAPDGTLLTSREFTAADTSGAEHPATWELALSFPTPHTVEGSFNLIEPGCEARHQFSGAHGGGHHSYPDLAAATPAARARARRMLRRVRAVAARRFPTLEAARAAGFTRYMVADKVADPGVFHLWSRRYNRDDRLLDPERPESLVYWKPPDPTAPRRLLAFMFRVRPGPLPRFAGTIPSWHTHKPGGDQMTHVWLTDDLRGAYANCLPMPELQRALHPFVFDDVPIEGHESQPCPTTEQASAASARAPAVRVGDNYFSPKTLTVKQHSTVTWRFVGKKVHNVTVKRGPVKFSSPSKVSGKFKQHMWRKGTYKIICSIHAGKQRMTLEVT